MSYGIFSLNLSFPRSFILELELTSPFMINGRTVRRDVTRSGDSCDGLIIAVPILFALTFGFYLEVALLP